LKLQTTKGGMSMRSAILLPVLLLAACSVNQDANNDTTSVQIDEEAAKNGFDAATATAGNIAGHISNDVQETGGKIQNEVGDVDVDVDVNADTNAQ
jgi:hypothetical protein